MRQLFKNRDTGTQVQVRPEKREISVPGGTPLSILRPGLPFMYQHMGNVIKTSTVQYIREVTVNHVVFETENSIYTVFYENAEAAGF